MANERNDLVLGWLRKGESDLLNARIILASEVEAKPYDTVCFHCQKAAEKSLKAYLIHLAIMFPKTHNIGQLIELGAVRDPDLTAFASAEELSPYGVDIRYPDDFYLPTEEEAQSAFDAASDIFRFVTKKCRQAPGMEPRGSDPKDHS
ncbi:MAG: HEPN domain-containing protein [Rectinemataceae bacterium]